MVHRWLQEVVTVTAVDISATQNALINGAFIDDVATYLINSANANTTFTTTTNVATTTTNVLQTYTLTDIIQKINNAGISNVTASSDNNRLKITKTTNTPQTQFSPYN